MFYLVSLTCCSIQKASSCPPKLFQPLTASVLQSWNKSCRMSSTFPKAYMTHSRSGERRWEEVSRRNHLKDLHWQNSWHQHEIQRWGIHFQMDPPASPSMLGSSVKNWNFITQHWVAPNRVLNQVINSCCRFLKCLRILLWQQVLKFSELETRIKLESRFSDSNIFPLKSYFNHKILNSQYLDSNVIILTLNTESKLYSQNNFNERRVQNLKQSKLQSLF